MPQPQVIQFTTEQGTSAPVNTVAPAVTGNLWVNQLLSCTTGTWTGDVSSGYTYQWKDGSGNISGATSSTYRIQSGEATKAIHCTVTATGTGGATTQDSNTTATVSPNRGHVGYTFSFA